MSTPDPPQNPAPASGAPNAEADAPGAPDAAGAAPDTPPAGAEPAGSSPPRRRRGRRWPHALSLLAWALLSALGESASAYATLYEVLTTFSKVIAPVLPFFSVQLVSWG